jgi:LmbE family N-acetylglucosaminyl deacetylase
MIKQPEQRSVQLDPLPFTTSLSFPMKSALAIAAHPDDIEFLMAGTLMLLRERGYQIHYFNLANGCYGTTKYSKEEIIRIRREEAIHAARKLGAVYHESICDDLAIFYDQPTLAKVAAVVRLVSPDIVLTHAPVDYMEDHTNTCRLAVTATFARGMPNFQTDPPQPIVAKKVALYHAQPYQHRDPLGNLVEPTLVVDITDVIERKHEALAEHLSQRSWLDESQGQDSYLNTMLELDAELGRIGGLFQYAEGWRQHYHVGLGDATENPLLDALKDRVLIARK